MPTTCCARTVRRAIAVAVVFVVVVVGAATLPAAEGNGRDRDRCTRKGSDTLISAPRVRVYRTGRDRFTFAYFACHRQTGRAARLGFRLAPEGYVYAGTRATAIRGSTIAYATSFANDSEDGSGPVYKIVVATLPVRSPAYRGQQFRALEISEPSDQLTDANVAIEKILIAPNRTIAYTICQSVGDDYDRCDRPLVGTRVVAVPFRGPTEAFGKAPGAGFGKAVVLDIGPGIDPRSLRLSPSGTRLAWDRDGTRRGARVPDAQP